MSIYIITLMMGFCAIFSFCMAGSEGTGSQTANTLPKVLISTSKGDITVELYADKSPNTVDNFIKYVESNFYDDTIFHRVIPKFMVQGGGFTADMRQKSTGAPIKIESNNGLKNVRGTIAMARTSDPDSATAQFFINTVDNSMLDYRAPTASGWGYTVFGRVVNGMDVVDAIEKARTTSKGMHQNVPEEVIVIKRVSKA